MQNHTPLCLIIRIYKTHLTNQQISDLPKYLLSQHSAAVVKSSSGICYFIIPSFDVQSVFLSAAKNNITFKRVDLFELRQKYKNEKNYLVFGNIKLVSFIFHADPQVEKFDSSIKRKIFFY